MMTCSDLFLLEILHAFRVRGCILSNYVDSVESGFISHLSLLSVAEVTAFIHGKDLFHLSQLRGSLCFSSSFLSVTPMMRCIHPHTEQLRLTVLRAIRANDTHTHTHPRGERKIDSCKNLILKDSGSIHNLRKSICVDVSSGFRTERRSTLCC